GTYNPLRPRPTPVCCLDTNNSARSAVRLSLSWEKNLFFRPWTGAVEALVAGTAMGQVGAGRVLDVVRERAGGGQGRGAFAQPDDDAVAVADVGEAEGRRLRLLAVGAARGGERTGDGVGLRRV